MTLKVEGRVVMVPCWNRAARMVALLLILNGSRYSEDLAVGSVSSVVKRITESPGTSPAVSMRMRVDDSNLGLAAMIAEGALQPRVTAAFELDDYGDAFRTIAERRVLGKIVFKF